MGGDAGESDHRSLVRVDAVRDSGDRRGGHHEMGLVLFVHNRDARGAVQPQAQAVALVLDRKAHGQRARLRIDLRRDAGDLRREYHVGVAAQAHVGWDALAYAREVLLEELRLKPDPREVGHSRERVVRGDDLTRHGTALSDLAGDRAGDLKERWVLAPRERRTQPPDGACNGVAGSLGGGSFSKGGDCILFRAKALLDERAQPLRVLPGRSSFGRGGGILAAKPRQVRGADEDHDLAGPHVVPFARQDLHDAPARTRAQERNRIRIGDDLAVQVETGGETPFLDTSSRDVRFAGGFGGDLHQLRSFVLLGGGLLRLRGSLFGVGLPRSAAALAGGPEEDEHQESTSPALHGAPASGATA